jgi:tripartite-type tricarboxylate transporter receptor subunit TctC
MNRRNFIEAGVVLSAGFLANANAQTKVGDYPSYPIKLIVGFGPGGSTDVTARIVSAKLYEEIGQRVVIENKPGGGSNIGSEMASRAAPDGYTLLLGTVANTINMSLYKNPGYDIVQDFEPISMLASAPTVLVVNPKLPVKTVSELIALARAQPDVLNFATSGVGTTPHLASEMLLRRFGIKMAHIAYKGAAPALTDTIAGVTQLGFKTALSAIPSIQSGQLRALAVCSPKRLALLPDVPTMAEAGVPDFEITSWNGLFAPKGTSAEIVAKLSAACARIALRKDVQETLAAQAADSLSSTPAEFKVFIEKEIKKWAAVVKSTGAQI